MENEENFTWTEEGLKEVELNYIDEVSAQWMYSKLAEYDKNKNSIFFRMLAKYEQQHAVIFGRLLAKLNRKNPGRRLLMQHRILVILARLFGVKVVLPIIHKVEVDAIDKFKRQVNTWKDPDAQYALQHTIPEEICHEIDLFSAMRKTGGMKGTLRSAILGANDGLGSILALAVGVAGASSSSKMVLMSSIAGLVAGAVSMAASNYVSVKAEYERDESLVRLQRDAIAVAMFAKQAQLVEFYKQKGLSHEEAESIVERLSKDKEKFLQTILNEQHGISETNFESPLLLAVYTGIAFMGAGLIPVMPFFVMPVMSGVLTSVALTCIALFFTGVIRALSTLSPFIKSGIEMCLVGMGSAAVTYLAGKAIGGVLN